MGGEQHRQSGGGGEDELLGRKRDDKGMEKIYSLFLSKKRET